MTVKKQRIFYVILFVALFLAEVLIALFVHDAFIRPYFGDVLVTVLLCALCRIFIPEKIRLLPVYIFLFAVAVEVSQYFHLVRLLGLGDIAFFQILMGTSFSWYDLVCYAAGCIVFGLLQWAVIRKKR